MKFYAVAKGRESGVFENWEECNKQVSGFSGAVFKSFTNKNDAGDYIKKFKGDDKFEITEKNRFQRLNEQGGEYNKRKFEMIEKDDEFEKEYEKYISIYTDGACSNNGTKHANAGIGIYFDGGEYKNISKEIDGIQTNNRAELTAIIEAMKIVECDENIIVFTDSQYAINGVSAKNKIFKNSDLFEEINHIMAARKGKTILRKVSGHSGKIDGNHMADLLAKKSL